MKKNKLLIACIVLLLSLSWNLPTWAQISYGGLPPSFSFSSLRQSKLPYEAPIDFNVNALRAEDIQREEDGLPPRVAKIIPTDLDLSESGEWITLPTGEVICKLELEADGALAIILYYSEFQIPEGGKLFIYNTNHTKVLGAYTSLTNPKRAEFATEFITGDKVILEYVAPSKNTGKANLFESTPKNILFPKADLTQNQPRIVISGIGYGYNHLRAAQIELRTRWSSEECEVNINCPEGDNWQNQKKGVARLVTPTGDNYVSLCSGTLVNNTAGNLDPLFLTAFHCFEGFSEALLNQTIYYFHYELPGCEDIPNLDPEGKTMTGAQMLASINTSGGSDGALLRLNQTIPEDYDVFYNGWDRSNNPATSGVGIHHPAGDVKKISTYTAPATTTTWNGEVTGATDAHWQVTYVATQSGHGVTERGSSGSPLFNQNGRVVGSLTGGNSSCSNLTGRNSYGKLWYHWDKATSKMAPFLDPTNSGAIVLDGTSASGSIIANFTASNTKIYASQSISYKDISFRATTWNWTFEGGSIQTFTGKNPPVISYNTPGTYQTKLIINQGTANEKTKSMTITVRLKENQCPQDVTVGTGTSTSQFPLGVSQRQSFSSAIYTKNEITAGISNFDPAKGISLKSISWNSGKATTRTRTIYVYLKEVDDATLTANTWTNEINDATLVYTSTNAWTNANGWVNIPFTTPFEYSGTKNLKVLVRTSTASATGYDNSSCAYTIASNTHMQWTATTATIPTINGSVNSNRPNIKLNIDVPCGVVQPMANFSIIGAGKVLFEENFENEEFPPTGWSIEKPGASSNQWIAGNPNSNNFNTIDPASTSSAVVGFDDNAEVNTWLKSTDLAITEAHTNIEFYALYSGPWLANGYLTFYISDDSGTNWTPKWTNKNHEITLPSAWRKQTVDLSEYVGKTIKFAWQYFGQGGDLAALDGIKILVVNDIAKTEISEGEFITFEDLSAGPPVSWEWSFPGGIPSTSTVQNPTVQYMKEGLFDVTLKIANNLGQNTKTIKGSVKVMAQIPETKFISHSGTLKQKNDGPFLPPSGGPVELEDKSGNYPKSWEWTLKGAMPSSSNSQNVETNYPGGANTYDVMLKTTNNAGTNVLSIPDYVKVDGTSEVWNIPLGDKGDKYYTNTYLTTYYITGSNPYYNRIAERFENAAPGEISKVNINTSKIGNPTLHVAIYSDNGGTPGNIIGSAITVVGDNITNGGYTTITFPTPIGVPGSFHIVVSGFTYYILGGGDLVAISSSTKQAGPNTINVYYQGLWTPINSIFSDLDISMNIVPEFTYTTTKVTSATTFKKKNIDPNPETVSFTTNGTGTWTATTSNEWITIENGTGIGSSSFSFTCKDNNRDLRSGLILLDAGGLKKYIVVQQAGINPTQLTGSYNDTDQSVDLIWKHEKAPLPPIPSLFDDIEKHTDFTINSAGAIGWSYIDGDASRTYGIGENTSFPGQSDPMAFIAFNPNSVTPSIQDPIFEAHSGSKYFACIAATEAPNNDWMISPKLNFTETFTYSFWAKSITDEYGKERIRVAYSTEGNTQADFTHVLTTGSYIEVPTGWTKYEYTIPANAKYVALNCISNDAFILMVDDIYIGTNTPESGHVDNNESTLSSLLPVNLKKSIKEQAAASLQIPSLDIKTMADKWGVKALHINESILKKTTEEVQLRSEAIAEIRWDDGTNKNAVGVGGSPYEVAAKFEPQDLSNYHGTKLKAVEIFPNVQATYKLKIRQNGVIIQTQTLNGLSYGSFNTITLSQPITIDATKDLMIGYEVSNYDAETYQSGLDKTPHKPKGDLISFDGINFSSLYTASGGAIDGNWNIAGILEDNTSENADITFNVYRDGVPVQEGLTSMVFKDTKPVSGKNTCYTVTATYNNDIESTKSPESCLFSKSVLTIQAVDVNRYPEEINPVFQATVTGNLLDGHTVSDILKMVTLTCSANQQSPIGEYDIDVSVKNAYPNLYSIKTVKGKLTVMPRISTIITSQPVGGSICAGSNYTFSVTAEGEELTYQWYKGHDRIAQATSSKYTITNATYNDYDSYYVEVMSKAGSIKSESVTLWVANPLPETLTFAEFPNPAEVGKTYTIRLTGYADVTNYTWSYSREGATFSPSPEGSNTMQVTFNNTAIGSGNIIVKLEHVCGPHMATQEIIVQKPTGMDNVEASGFKVYPNPATDMIKVSGTKHMEQGIKIYSVVGKLVGIYDAENSETIINLSGYFKGTYMLYYNGQTRKIIKK